MHRLTARLIALLVLAASSLYGIGVVLGQDASAPSPLPGNASVVAQGVAAMPPGDLAWRVTRATTAPTTALPARATPGFLLADQGVLLVNNARAKSQVRLAAGEAAFAPSAAQLEEVPLAEPLVYYRIDLVAAADAANAGNDESIFVGEPFASPGGNRDLDLARDLLGPGETLQLALAGRAAPTLLLVTSGQLDLVPASNPSAAPVPLPAGQGAALNGDVIATAADAGATFVLALVGEETPAIGAQRAAPTPTATPEPTATPLPAIASLALFAYACPAGYAGDQFAADCLEPLADIPFSATASETGATLDGTTGPDGGIAFGDLEPGGYTITSGMPAEFVTPLIACGADSGDVAAGAAEGEAIGASVTLQAGMNASCSWYAVPSQEQAENEGTIGVTVHFCPGTPIDPATDCTLGDPIGAVINGPVVLTTDAGSALPAAVGGGVVSWGEGGGLPFGDYSLQPGGIAAPEGYAISEVRGSVGGSGNGWSFAVDEANPNAYLDVIYVPTVQPQATFATGVENGSGNADGDRDGLRDGQEARLGTDPANPDTDEDGLFDGAEVAAETDPTNPDSDGDGFGDNQEAVNRSDPTDPASIPETGGPAIDTDGDGLIDSQEEESGTNPAAADSDGDGLSDFAEVGFEPGSATGTDPTAWDTDGDGVSDGQEVANGTDPTDPASA